ncbi:4068_t:CDS:2, partial [Gigaspora margarita]
WMDRQIKNTFGESQNSMVIFRDLENTVIQIAIQYIRARTFRFTLPTFTRWSSFFVSLQVRNNDQYLKYAAYEMGSRL